MREVPRGRFEVRPGLGAAAEAAVERRGAQAHLAGTGIPGPVGEERLVMLERLDGLARVLLPRARDVVVGVAGGRRENQEEKGDETPHPLKYAMFAEAEKAAF